MQVGNFSLENVLLYTTIELNIKTYIIKNVALANQETLSPTPESGLKQLVSDASLKILNAIESRYNSNRSNFDTGGRKDSDVLFNTLRLEIQNGRNPILAAFQAFTNLRNYLETSQNKHDARLLAGLDLFLGALIIVLPGIENKSGFSLLFIQKLHQATNVLMREAEHTVSYEDEGVEIRLTADDDSGYVTGGSVRAKKPNKNEDEK